MQKKIFRLYSIFDDIGDAVYEDKVFTQPCMLKIKIVFSLCLMFITWLYYDMSKHI